MTYAFSRPWGNLQWLLPRLQIQDWTLLGCLNPEDRCLGTWKTLKAANFLRSSKMLLIQDRRSRFTDTWVQKTASNVDQYLANGGDRDDLLFHPLIGEESRLDDSAHSFKQSSNGNVIVDISAMPKKFFFRIIKLIIEDESTNNLLVTYTIPKKYSSGKLAEDPRPCAALPSFKPIDPRRQESPTAIIIGIGFEPFALADLLSDHTSVEISVKMMLAFPTTPQAYRRSLDFIRSIQEVVPRPDYKRLVVDANNVSDTFDIIARNTQGQAILAPYGPKPMSLAMCLYAINNPASVEVMYSQPTVYNPDYSEGIAEDTNGHAQIYAYCIRKGRNDYF